MPTRQRTYIAIDLKSFYASVECVERGLDPLTTNLVVADESKTDKTICLAVTPALKSFGVPGRPRLFEVNQRLRYLNSTRRGAPSTSLTELTADPNRAVSTLIAPPRMAFYIDYSTRVYNVYLKYIAPEDIHVYSIDEVFIDATAYLATYKMTAHELAMTMIKDVLTTTGITATAGIGTNLYLCKVAMDIVAKHLPADADGVRIASLDEKTYRQQLWNHRPLTDFWRIGHGTADRLARIGIHTMGQIARCSVHHEEVLYKIFGVNAELLIDHAWGWEPCLISDIKAYRPEMHSLSRGQVLSRPYTSEEAKIVVKAIADSLALELVDKHLLADQIVLHIGYDRTNLPQSPTHQGQRTMLTEAVTDHYGRMVPKPAHGSANIEHPTSSSRLITEAVMQVFDRTTDPALLIRRINICVNHVIPECLYDPTETQHIQLDIFSDPEQIQVNELKKKEDLSKERKMQEAILGIKKKYGRNALLKGRDFEDAATTRERNSQIGGHKA